MTADKVIPAISPFGGSVLRTSLPNDLEATLRQALAQGQTHAPEAGAAGGAVEAAEPAGEHSHGA